MLAKWFLIVFKAALHPNNIPPKSLLELGLWYDNFVRDKDLPSVLPPYLCIVLMHKWCTWHSGSSLTKILSPLMTTIVVPPSDPLRSNLKYEGCTSWYPASTSPLLLTLHCWLVEWSPLFASWLEWLSHQNYCGVHSIHRRHRRCHYCFCLSHRSLAS